MKRSLLVAMLVVASCGGAPPEQPPTVLIAPSSAKSAGPGQPAQTVVYPDPAAHPAHRSWSIRAGCDQTVAHSVVETCAGVIYAMASVPGPMPKHQRGSARPRHTLALRLTDGGELWSSTAATVPLFMGGGKLVALREGDVGSAAKVLLLAPANGHAVGSCPGKLPALGFRASYNFENKVRGSRHEGQGFIHGSSRRWYGGGVAPSPERLQAENQRSTSLHAVRFQGSACTVEPAAPAALEASTPPAYTLKRSQEGSEWVYTVVGPSGTRFEAARGALGGHATHSAAGRHVRVRLQLSSTGVSRYQYTYRDAETGAMVAQYEAQQAYGGAFLVVGDRIVSVTTGIVRVWDLEGREVWQRSLASLGYHGSAPPARPGGPR